MRAILKILMIPLFHRDRQFRNQIIMYQFLKERCAVETLLFLWGKVFGARS